METFEEIGMMHPNANSVHPRRKCEEWQKDMKEHEKCVPIFIKKEDNNV